MFSLQVGLVFPLGKGHDYAGGVFNNMTKLRFYFNKRFSNAGGEAANDMCSDSGDSWPVLSWMPANSGALPGDVSELLKPSIAGPREIFPAELWEGEKRPVYGPCCAFVTGSFHLGNGFLHLSHLRPSEP